MRFRAERVVATRIGSGGLESLECCSGYFLCSLVLAAQSLSISGSLIKYIEWIVPSLFEGSRDHIFQELSLGNQGMVGIVIIIIICCAFDPKGLVMNFSGVNSSVRQGGPWDCVFLV